jgi:hypothetical protein
MEQKQVVLLLWEGLGGAVRKIFPLFFWVSFNFVVILLSCTLLPIVLKLLLSLIFKLHLITRLIHF